MDALLKSTACLLGALVLCAPVCGAADAHKPEQAPPSRLLGRASRGDVEAQKALAAMYIDGTGVPQDYAQAVEWLKKAAHRGDPAAQVELGYLMQYGLGTRPDIRAAANWYALAAASGWAGGQLNLAIMYIKGQGVRKDPTAAFSLLSRAARSGDAYAQAYLGNLYVLGLGVAPDLRKAEELFELSAKKHNSVALFNLGLLHSGAHGHAVQPQRAKEYLSAALEQGYSPAAHSLGLLLVNHHELDTNGEGVALLRRSANEGYWGSAAAMGVLYRDGQCVDEDAAEAYRWFRIAAIKRPSEMGRLESSFALLQPRLTEAQRASLDREAEDWARAHPYHPTITLAVSSGHVRVIPADVAESR